MKSTPYSNLLRFACPALGFFILTAVLIGCGKSDAPPQALSADQLVPALEKAFAIAQPPLAPLVQTTTASLKEQNYPHAYSGLQNLAGMTGLTREQGRVLASELLAVNSLLQNAQSQGDQLATRTLQYYRATK